MLQAEAKAAEMRTFLETIYNGTGKKEDFASMSDDQVMEMASTGLPRRCGCCQRPHRHTHTGSTV
jgi:DNA-directed RNA polymerase subunit beta